MAFKELSFNSFYFGRGVPWSSKNSVLTVSTLAECDALQRTQF